MDNKAKASLITLPLQGEIRVRCDPAFSVTNWVSTILQAIPTPLCQTVVLKLVKSLLQLRSPRSQIRTQKKMRRCLGELIVGRVSYHGTDAPAPRHLRSCIGALRRKRQPILIVPEYAIHRAHQLRQLAAIRSKVEVVSLEALFAVGIFFAAAERGLAIPAILESLLSEYNCGLHDAWCPKIILEWSRGK